MLPAALHLSSGAVIYVLMACSCMSVQARCSNNCVCNSEKYNVRCTKRLLLFDVPQNIPDNIAFLQVDNLHKQSIQRKDFSKFQNLTYLHLNGGKIQIVENNTFADLTKLQDLDLRGNGFMTLGRDTFRSLRQLNHLILANNRLSSVEGEMLNHLTNLLHLDLRNNKLTALPWNLRLPLLQTMYLDTNNIEKLEGPNMENPFRHLNNLEVIILSGNKIKSLDFGLFKQLHLLKTLDVARNRIYKIVNSKESATLKQLTTFKINNNKIQTFPRDFETVLVTIAQYHNIVPWRVTLDLSANPLHCNCEMHWYRALLDDNQFQYFENYGSCVSPTFVNDLKTLPVVSFKCDPPIIDRAYFVDGRSRSSGKSVYFFCHARGNPAPTVTWYLPSGLNQTQDPPINKTNYNNSAVYVLNPFTPADAGEYLCRASNVHGSADKYVLKTDAVGTLSSTTSADRISRKPATKRPGVDKDGDWNINIPFEVKVAAAASFGFFLLLSLIALCLFLRRRKKNSRNRKRSGRCCSCCGNKKQSTLVPLDGSNDASPTASHDRT